MSPGASFGTPTNFAKREFKEVTIGVSVRTVRAASLIPSAAANFCGLLIPRFFAAFTVPPIWKYQRDLQQEMLSVHL
jgi:hypothetical protein